MEKAHLGNGIFVEATNEGIRITSSNGRHVFDLIEMDNEDMLDTFLGWIDAYISELKSIKDNTTYDTPEYPHV